MKIVAGVWIWAMLSMIVCVGMQTVTNRKAAQVLPEKDSVPYRRDVKSVLLCLTVAAFSAVAGYAAALRAVSVMAWIQLSVSYVVVLSAAVIDFKLYIIPNFLVLFLILGRLAVIVCELMTGSFIVENLISSILGCVFCFMVLMGMDKICRGGIGKGDVKFLAALGFADGAYAVLSVLLLALICCILVSAVLLLLKKVTMKDHLPFGPYIWMGYLCMILLAY